MPRISNTNYLERRGRLRADWANGGQLIRTLEQKQQWALHDFYQFAHELSETEIIQRRQTATQKDASLTKVAGLAYRSFTKKLNLAQGAATPRTTAVASHGRRRSRGGPLIAWADPNHVVDRDLLAQAIRLHFSEIRQKDQISAQNNPCTDTNQD